MKRKLTPLKLNKEFKRAYYQGKFKAHPFLVTYAVKNRVKKPRIGITTGKKVGGAVTRNRARRVIKQAYRLLLWEEGKEKLPLSGYDVVFVARAATPLQKMQSIKNVMQKQLTALLPPKTEKNGKVRQKGSNE